MTSQTSEPKKSNLACLLCGSQRLREVDRLTGKKIRDEQCGFNFFNPALAGGENFCHEILYVGGGSGPFLEMAKQASYEVNQRLAKGVYMSQMESGSDTLPKGMSLAYLRGGLKYVFPQWGISIYSLFQKS